jgi:hypothetical protein
MRPTCQRKHTADQVCWEQVAADRQAGNDSVEEMQKKTAKHVEEKHK